MLKTFTLKAPYFSNICFCKGLFVFTLFFANTAISQSYHYFEIAVRTAQDRPLNYKLFLSLEIDGTANARIVYTDPESQTQKLVSQQYAPIFNAGSVAAPNLLSTTSEVDYLQGIEDSFYVATQIRLKQITEEGESFFVPEQLNYLDSSKEWQGASTISNKTYTDEELLLNKGILEVFFQKDDPFYTYLSNAGLRGDLSFFERMSRLHLIIVANTLDDSIGITTQKDLDKTQKFFRKLSQSMKITMLETTISGSDFGIRNVKRALRKLKVNRNDIVVFYYSGHGFRFASDASLYPRISLRTNKSQDILRNNLVLEDIYKTILTKNARVNIVLGDCCNNEVDDRIPQGAEVLNPRSLSGTTLNLVNCRTFFFPERPFSVIIGSAKKGQLAVSNSTLGGFFTHFFLAELEKSMFTSKGSKSWPDLFSQTMNKATFQATSSRQCSGQICRQVAQIGLRR